MTTIATICARGGSKGLPGKNILPFAGLPLIAHSIRFALQQPAISTVYMSTDNPEIARIARETDQFAMLRKLELSAEQHLIVAAHCARFGVDPGGPICRGSTPF